MTEHLVVPGRRLGRRQPKRAPGLHLGRYLTGVAPVHPATSDHISEVPDWGLWGNDQYGDCGPVSVGNDVKLVTRYLAGTAVSVSEADIFDLYRRSGNPDFDPATDAGDNGVDLQTMLEALVAGGIAGRKPVAFAAVDHTNLDELRASIAIFGSLLLGVDLQVAQQAQTGSGCWDYAPSAEWGGHAIVAGRYTSAAAGADLAVVTWAEVVGVTDAFLTHQLAEAWVVIWPEHLGTAEFQQGVDLQALAADYRELTGHALPLPSPAPTPGPTPPEDPAKLLAELAALIRADITAVEEWLTAHGL